MRKSRADRTPVSAIMTPDVLCVRADVSVDALAALLLEHEISGVPVVDAAGAPIGVVSKTDLVRERYENQDTLEVRTYGARETGGYHESNVGRTLVADVMVGMTFALPEDATLSQASALMAYEGVHRVPVVSADGKVVGILSAIDVLWWLANQDGYLIAKRHA
jgi:CBS domain-containing protein